MIVTDMTKGYWYESKEWLESVHKMNNRIIEVCEEFDGEDAHIEYRIYFHDTLFESDGFYVVNKEAVAKIKEYNAKATITQEIEKATT